jgi:hypothetical protein
MSTFFGADVAELRQLATTFDNAATQLTKTRNSVGGNVQSSPWTGPDAMRFRSTWDSQSATQLASAAERLSLAATSLRKNADQQESASSVSGGVGGVPGTAQTPVFSDSTTAQTTSTWNGTTAHVVDHIDAKTTDVEDASSGLNGTADGTAGEANGALQADGSLHGEAGVRASDTTTHDLGGGATGSTTESSFAGAEGTVSGTGSVGVDGAKADVGANLFAGTDSSVQAQFAGHGVTAGIGAGLLAGVGVMATGHVEIGWDHIGVDAELGASVGVGLKVAPSIDVSPNQIVDDLGDLFGVKW